MSKRTCRNCQVEKEDIEFYKRKSGSLAGECKSCSNQRSREWSYKNKARKSELTRRSRNKAKLLYPDLLKKKDRDKNLKSAYGVSGDWYRLKEKEQGGVCRICKEPPTGKYKHLFVDHNHATGLPRALLCMMCNMAVGAVRESPELAVAVSLYIKEHRE